MLDPRVGFLSNFSPSAILQPGRLGPVGSCLYFPGHASRNGGRWIRTHTLLLWAIPSIFPCSVLVDHQCRFRRKVPAGWFILALDMRPGAAGIVTPYLPYLYVAITYVPPNGARWLGFIRRGFANLPRLRSSGLRHRGVSHFLSSRNSVCHSIVPSHSDSQSRVLISLFPFLRDPSISKPLSSSLQPPRTRAYSLVFFL